MKKLRVLLLAIISCICLCSLYACSLSFGKVTAAEEYRLEVGMTIDNYRLDQKTSDGAPVRTEFNNAVQSITVKKPGGVYLEYLYQKTDNSISYTKYTLSTDSEGKEFRNIIDECVYGDGSKLSNNLTYIYNDFEIVVEVGDVVVFKVVNFLFEGLYEKPDGKSIYDTYRWSLRNLLINNSLYEEYNTNEDLRNEFGSFGEFFNDEDMRAEYEVDAYGAQDIAIGFTPRNVSSYTFSFEILELSNSDTYRVYLDYYSDQIIKYQPVTGLYNMTVASNKYDILQGNISFDLLSRAEIYSRNYDANGNYVENGGYDKFGNAFDPTQEGYLFYNENGSLVVEDKYLAWDYVAESLYPALITDVNTEIIQIVDETFDDDGNLVSTPLVLQAYVDEMGKVVAYIDADGNITSLKDGENVKLDDDKYIMDKQPSGEFDYRLGSVDLNNDGIISDNETYKIKARLAFNTDAVNERTVIYAKQTNATGNVSYLRYEHYIGGGTLRRRQVKFGANKNTSKKEYPLGQLLEETFDTHLFYEDLWAIKEEEFNSEDFVSNVPSASTVNEGDIIRVNIAPNEGYYIDTITINSVTYKYDNKTASAYEIKIPAIEGVIDMKNYIIIEEQTLDMAGGSLIVTAGAQGFMPSIDVTYKAIDLVSAPEGTGSGSDSGSSSSGSTSASTSTSTSGSSSSSISTSTGTSAGTSSGTSSSGTSSTPSTQEYTLTITYVGLPSGSGVTNYSEGYAQGETYSVTSPSVNGYTPDVAVVSGTMDASNRNITVTYTINQHSLTINYSGAGSATPNNFSQNYDYGATYSVTVPTVTGYTASQSVVSGTITSNTTIDVTYTINSYTLTINYAGAGSSTPSQYTQDYYYNASYSVTSPAVTGFTASPATVAGNMPANDLTVDVTYTVNSYPLTIYYVLAEGGTAHDTYTAQVPYGQTYVVTSPDIGNGYVADIKTVSGTMNSTSGVTVTVTYTKTTLTDVPYNSTTLNDANFKNNDKSANITATGYTSELINDEQYFATNTSGTEISGTNLFFEAEFKVTNNSNNGTEQNAKMGIYIVAANAWDTNGSFLYFDLAGTLGASKTVAVGSHTAGTGWTNWTVQSNSTACGDYVNGFVKLSVYKSGSTLTAYVGGMQVFTWTDSNLSGTAYINIRSFNTSYTVQNAKWATSNPYAGGNAGLILADNITATNFYYETQFDPEAISNTSDHWVKGGILVTDASTGESLYFYADLGDHASTGTASLVNNNGLGLVYQSAGGSYNWNNDHRETVLPSGKFNALDSNKFAVYKEGAQMYFLLNDEVIFATNNYTGLSGNITFGIDGGAAMTFGYSASKYTTDSTLLASLKTSLNLGLEITVDGSLGEWGTKASNYYGKAATDSSGKYFKAYAFKGANAVYVGFEINSTSWVTTDTSGDWWLNTNVELRAMDYSSDEQIYATAGGRSRNVIDYAFVRSGNITYIEMAIAYNVTAKTAADTELNLNFAACMVGDSVAGMDHGNASTFWCGPVWCDLAATTFKTTANGLSTTLYS